MGEQCGENASCKATQGQARTPVINRLF